MNNAEIKIAELITTMENVSNAYKGSVERYMNFHKSNSIPATFVELAIQIDYMERQIADTKARLEKFKYYNFSIDYIKNIIAGKFGVKDYYDIEKIELIENKNTVSILIKGNQI